MTYFKDRNKLRNEYSGHEEISEGLRRRITTVVENLYSNFRYDYRPELQYELDFQLPELKGMGIVPIVKSVASFENVFHALEIFIKHASIVQGNMLRVVREFEKTFLHSGSVYKVTPVGEITLRIDTELAENISKAEKIFEEKSEDNLARFRSAVGGLISREEDPKNVVKDVQIAFEDYVKSITNKSDFSESIKELVKQGTISENQRKVLDKIQVYRSNTDGIAHAAEKEPVGEVDALWFIDTVTAQVKLIDRKRKQSIK